MGRWSMRSGEIEGYRGVDSARARLIGDPDDPELLVTAGLEATADLTELRQRTPSTSTQASRLRCPTIPRQRLRTVGTRGYTKAP
ncbi:MAG: hypothetical protein ACR2MP_20920 [Streptosporangiaceae bacterium]